MDFKIIFALMFLLSFNAMGKSSGVPSDHSNAIKYAISYCLSVSYPNSKFGNDASHVSGGYIEIGSYGIHVYEAARNFVDNYIKKKYIGKHGGDLSIMQCIDLSNSVVLYSELDKVANKSLQ